MKNVPIDGTPTRRGLLKGIAAGTGTLAAASAFPGFIQAQSSEPIRLGFQLHRTGIGAAYGRWYERTAQAALKVLNDAGGINGRQVEILFEDDGTDPKRGAEVVEKFATQAKCDAVFGTLFSNVVVGTAPRAGRIEDPLSRLLRGPPRRLRGDEPLDASSPASPT